MTAIGLKSVALRPGDDPEAGKLAENLHSVDFADKRAGSLFVSGLSFGGVTIGDVVTDGYDAHTTSQRVGVVLPLSGVFGYHSGKTSFKAVGSQALLLRPGTRRSAIRADRGGRSRFLCLLVPESPHLKRLQAGEPSVLPIGSSPEARSLRGFLAYAFSELRNADSPLQRPRVFESMEAMIVEMVDGLCGGAAQSPASEAATAKRVRAALEFMHSHADDALSVEQIARAAGIGPRRLQAAFHGILEMSPREKLTEIRLENARARLEAPGEVTTVTDAALESGFAHLGRFAAAYRQRFGESPSETLRRART